MVQKATVESTSDCEKRQREIVIDRAYYVSTGRVFEETAQRQHRGSGHLHRGSQRQADCRTTELPTSAERWSL